MCTSVKIPTAVTVATPGLRTCRMPSAPLVPLLPEMLIRPL
jgi:hypothetical protein